MVDGRMRLVKVVDPVLSPVLNFCREVKIYEILMCSGR